MKIEKELFEELVKKAFDDLPKNFKDSLENIEVLIEEKPSKELLRNLGMKSPMSLLGLYHGVPIKSRGYYYGNVLPDRIVIYKRPLEALSRDIKELKEKINEVLLHEIGHYFGLSERRLEEIEDEE